MVSLYVLMITLFTFPIILRRIDIWQKNMYDISENKGNGIFTEIRLNSRFKKLFNFKMEGNYYALVIARAIIAYVILITGISISIISLFIPYGSGWIFLYVCFAIYFIEYLIWLSFRVIVSIILIIIPMVSRGKEE